MLASRDLELLTAFVDGDLSRRQRNAVSHLLRHSSEARALLAEMQQIAQILKNLPKRKLDSPLAEQILNEIERRGLQPIIPRPVVKFHIPRWARMTIAASLLLVVSGLLYLNFHPALLKSGPIAQGPLAAPAPFLRLDFQDLNQEAKRSLLAGQLRKEPSVHVDVTVRDQTVAVERLADALRDCGVRLLQDAASQAALTEGRGAVQYIVYAENVKPEELATILEKLAIAKGVTFEELALAPLSAADKTSLSTWIGLEAIDNANNLDTLKRKKLFDGAIIAAPDRAAPADDDDSDRFALVLASDAASGTLAPSVQHFLAQRREQHPGTLQVLFVIHKA